jgi:hypothetical protein
MWVSLSLSLSLCALVLTREHVHTFLTRRSQTCLADLFRSRPGTLCRSRVLQALSHLAELEYAVRAEPQLRLYSSSLLICFDSFCACTCSHSCRVTAQRPGQQAIAFPLINGTHKSFFQEDGSVSSPPLPRACSTGSLSCPPLPRACSTVTVRVIDFGQTTLASSLPGPDEGFLLGLRTVRELLQRLLAG